MAAPVQTPEQREEKEEKEEKGARHPIWVNQARRLPKPPGFGAWHLLLGAWHLLLRRESPGQ
jgi:hypothetical protein